MHPRRLALILTALAVAASPAAAEAATIDAGSLRARTASDPWRLDFVDGAGRSVLREAARRDLGPSGTLGFRTAAGWFHATRVVSERRDGRAYVATLATSDPLGRRLSVRIERDAEGVIRLRARGGPTAGVTATGIGFDARDGERYLGFGERSNAVDQRGNAVENYVAEGPYQPEERPIISAFVPPPAITRATTPPLPDPWLLSTAGYGVLVDNAETSAGSGSGASGRTAGAWRRRRRRSACACSRAPGRRASFGASPPGSGANHRRPPTGSDPGTSPAGATRAASSSTSSAATFRSRSPRRTRTTCPAATTREPRPTSALAPRAFTTRVSP